MKDYVIDVLMNIGVPAGIKGFTYICDAIELFNTDPYYPDGKISALYIDIAKKYHTTPSRVERSIRHAFDIALTKGDPDMVSRYLDLTNRQNSTLLRTLYLRIGQERRRHQAERHHQQCNPQTCTSQTCEFKAQIYMEAMKTLSEEIESLFNRTLASVRDDIHPTDDGQSERSCSGFPKSLKILKTRLFLILFLSSLKTAPQNNICLNFTWFYLAFHI